MLTTIRDDMLGVLDATGSFKEHEAYQGELEDLLKKPKRTPAVYVTLGSGTFDQKKLKPPVTPKFEMFWDTILFIPSIGLASKSTEKGFELIEDVIKHVDDGGLSGLVTVGGILWPVDLQLVQVTGGSAVYRISFTITSDNY